MRLKYPHLVNGSWASSGPMNVKADFWEYKDVMTDAIRRVGGDACYTTVKNAFLAMERLVTEGDVQRLQASFNLCQPLDLPTDVQHFFYEISDIVAGLVQVHRGTDIQRACDLMRREKEENSKDDLDAFAAWVKNGQWKCLDMGYQSRLTKFRDTNLAADANQQMRQWTYQTCTVQTLLLIILIIISKLLTF